MNSQSDEEEIDIQDLTHRELVAITWQQLGVRAGRSTSAEDMHSMLAYEADPEDVVYNPVNDMRDTLIAFIDGHRDQLSLPCSGNCYEHTDGTVIACYQQFTEDTSGKAH